MRKKRSSLQLLMNALSNEIRFIQTLSGHLKMLTYLSQFFWICCFSLLAYWRKRSRGLAPKPSLLWENTHINIQKRCNVSSLCSKCISTSKIDSIGVRRCTSLQYFTENQLCWIFKWEKCISVTSLSSNLGLPPNLELNVDSSLPRNSQSLCVDVLAGIVWPQL